MDIRIRRRRIASWLPKSFIGKQQRGSILLAQCNKLISRTRSPRLSGRKYPTKLQNGETANLSSSALKISYLWISVALVSSSSCIRQNASSDASRLSLIGRLLVCMSAIRLANLWFLPHHRSSSRGRLLFAVFRLLDLAIHRGFSFHWRCFFDIVYYGVSGCMCFGWIQC